MTGAERWIADYRHLRDDVAAYRLPRDVIALDGPEAASYLQGQLSQDLAALAIGGSVDTLVLAPDGKFEALARVVRVADEVFHLDVDGGHGDALAERLARFKLRSRFVIERLDWSCVALRGPVLPEPSALRAPVVVPFEWNGLVGVDLLGPTDEIEVPASVPWCAEEAWEAVRIESGIPVMGRELTVGLIPAETGTVERAVSFTKGCFTGQELVARIDSRGAQVPHHLEGLVIDGAPEPSSLAGAALLAEDSDKAIGHVTSAAWCPGLDSVGALGYVHRTVTVPGPVRVVAPGTGPEQALSATVRSLPLV